MKSFKVILVVFVAGVFAGAGTVALLEWMEVEVPVFGEYQPEEGEGWPEMEAETQRLMARLGEQRAEINRLQAELASREANAPEEGDADELTEEERREKRREERQAEMQARMDERMQMRVSELADTYGLSEAQRQLLAEVFNQQRENFRARRNGEDVAPFSFDAALEGIMTDDQFAQYLEDSQEEIYNRAEMMATTQMVRMSQDLKLQPEQQDLVYDAIHYTAQEAMIARQSGEDFQMRKVLNERLSSVLTDEQMQAFQASEDDGRGGRRQRPGP